MLAYLPETEKGEGSEKDMLIPEFVSSVQSCVLLSAPDPAVDFSHVLRSYRQSLVLTAVKTQHQICLDLMFFAFSSWPDFYLMTQDSRISWVSSRCLCCSHSKSDWQYGFNFKLVFLCRRLVRTEIRYFYWFFIDTVSAACETVWDTLDSDIRFIWFCTSLPPLVDACQNRNLNNNALVE